MMFSSPPYFDLEAYSDDSEQSIKKNSGFENWLNNFMLKSMRKIIAHLRPGGLMCININISRAYKDDWVTPLIAFNEGCTYLGCVSSYKKEANNVQPVWIWMKHTLRPDFKVNVPMFHDFNIVKAEGTSVADIKKFSSKIKNTVTFLDIPIPVAEAIKYPIWKYIDGVATIFINNSGIKLPLTMLHEKLNNFTLEGCKWHVIKKRWYPYGFPVPEKYTQFIYEDTKNVVIRVESGHLNELRFITDKFTLTCSKQNNFSPWSVYFKNKMDMSPRDFNYWAWQNNILCITSSDSITISVLEFLKTAGFSLKRIFQFENDTPQIITSAIMYVGCDFMYIKNHHQEYADAATTILNLYKHKIKS